MQTALFWILDYPKRVQGSCTASCILDCSVIWTSSSLPCLVELSSSLTEATFPVVTAICWVLVTAAAPFVAGGHSAGIQTYRFQNPHLPFMKHLKIFASYQARLNPSLKKSCLYPTTTSSVISREYFIPYITEFLPEIISLIEIVLVLELTLCVYLPVITSWSTTASNFSRTFLPQFLGCVICSPGGRPVTFTSPFLYRV